MGIATILSDEESRGTAEYLNLIAWNSGINSIVSDIEYLRILYTEDGSHAVPTLNGKEMKSIMKLYPLEWLAREAGNDELTACDLEQMDFIEPAWKLVLGNKAILPVLWEMFPGHPNLLPSYYDS